MLTIKLFAKFREIFGRGELQVEWQASMCTVADLRQRLLADDPRWQDILNDTKLIVAVNQERCSLEQSIQANDEIAFFPPVSGG